MAPTTKKCLCESRPAHKPSTIMATDSLFLMTRYVVLSMVGRPNDCPSEVANKLLRLVRKVESENGPFFDSVCKELKLSAENAKSVFFQVADEIFANQENWGRVVSFFAFSAKVAQYFESLGSEEIVDEVISWTRNYLNSLRWIEGNGGGWETFQHKFNPDPEPASSGSSSSFWHAGFLVTATLGLGAFIVTCKS